MNPTAPFSNQTIICGRPHEGGTSLVEALQSQGAQVISQPGLVLSGIEQPDAAREQLAMIASSDLVIVVSPFAARAALDLLPADRWPADTTLMVVGRQTARTLNEAGLDAVCPADGEGSEALLDTLNDRYSTDELSLKKAYILCAESGRRMLHESLAAACHSVTDIHVYCRRPADVTNDLKSWLAHYCAMPLTEQMDNIPVLIATSVAIAERLGNILSEHKTAENERIRETIWRHWPLVVSSPRIMAAAFEAGWKQVNLSPGADDSALIETLTHSLTAVTTDDSDFGSR